MLGLEHQESRRIWVSAIMNIVLSYYGCSARNSLLCTSKSVWRCPGWRVHHPGSGTKAAEASVVGKDAR